MVIRWRDLGVVTVLGNYSLPDGRLIEGVTEEHIQTAKEIIDEGTDPLVNLIVSSGLDGRKHYRLGKFE